MSETRLRRSGRSSQLWRRWFAGRIRRGEESCRGCGLVTVHVSQVPGGLRFGHIRAASLGGGPELGNTTIVCGDCDVVMGPRDWTGLFDPLCEEASWPATAAEIDNWARHRIVVRPARVRW